MINGTIACDVISLIINDEIADDVVDDNIGDEDTDIMDVMVRVENDDNNNNNNNKDDGLVPKTTTTTTTTATLITPSKAMTTTLATATTTAAMATAITSTATATATATTTTTATITSTSTTTSTSTSTSMSTETGTETDVDVTEFGTLVICPECSVDFIGTNIYDCGTCWFFADKNPLRQAVVVGRAKIHDAKKEAIRVEKIIQAALQTHDKTAIQKVVQKKVKTTTQRKKQYRPPEFVVQKRTYHSWNRPKEKTMGETIFYRMEIQHFIYMNEYYGYSKNFVFKRDMGMYVFNKDTPERPIYNRRCEEMLSNMSNHEGPTVETIRNLIAFTTEECKDALRQQWEAALKLFPIGSIKRCMLALIFIKAANGVGDAQTVPYFKAIAHRMADPNDELYNMTLHELTKPLFVASLFRRCSKWVKNSCFVCNLAQYLIDYKDGEFPNNKEFYIGLYEMGAKSVSLFMWAAFKKTSWLAVDFHVYESMRALGWTNALTAEEASYQIYKLGIVPAEFSTILNDAFGSIGQITGIISDTASTQQTKYENFTVLIAKVDAEKQDVINILEVLRDYYAGGVQ